jgi:uncharacterized membrane protein
VVFLITWSLVGVAAPAPIFAATVAPLPAVGSLYHMVIEVAHKQVPLPPGFWQVVATGDEFLPDNRLGAYGVVESLVLFKLDGNFVDSFLVIHVNALPVDRGWGTNSECSTHSLPMIRVYDNGGANLFCAFGGPVRLRHDQAAPGYWFDALKLATNKKWSITERWVMAGYRISDRHDVVEVRYYYSTTLPPSAIAPQPYPPGVIAVSWWPLPPPAAAEPKQQPPWLSALSDWSQAMKNAEELGFRGQINNDQEIPNLPSERTPPNTTTTDELKTEQPDTLTSLFKRSVLKMLSWKVLGISSGLAIKYLFIGDIATALSLQVATSTVTAVLYVGYDMVWATLFPDRYNPLIDFTAVTLPS